MLPAIPLIVGGVLALSGGGLAAYTVSKSSQLAKDAETTINAASAGVERSTKSFAALAAIGAVCYIGVLYAQKKFS